jgi:ribosomal protein S3
MFGYDKSILGLKLLIGGRLKGKLRKKKIFIQTGKIPVQTIAQDIEFTRLHVFSKYGVFGFKFWVCFKTN